MEHSVVVVVFTTVFPRPADPLTGVFVERRLQEVARARDLLVVAPTPFFRYDAGEAEEMRGRLKVLRPRFLYLPKVLRVLHPIWLALSAWRTVSRACRSGTVTLLDAHFGYPDGAAAALLARAFGVGLVVTLRGNELAVEADRVLVPWLRWTLKRARAVIALSEDLAALSRRLAPATPVHVVPNGVELDHFVPVDRAAARARLHIPADATVVLSVGHLTKRKGFHHLVDMLPLLASRLPDVHLVIGGGPVPEGHGYERTLAELVAGSPVADRIRLTGPIAPAELPAWFGSADLFVLNSSREGSPNVVLEALACGCPVVATSVGEVDQLVSPQNGAVVSTSATLQELADTIEREVARTRDRQVVRDTVVTRSWTSVGEAVVRVWNEATAGTSKPHQTS